jgi:hypothetical protein
MDLRGALFNLLFYDQHQQLNRLAPTHWKVPHKKAPMPRPLFRGCALLTTSLFSIKQHLYPGDRPYP